jgi:hypothetical protein
MLSFVKAVQTDRGWSAGRMGFLMTVGLSNIIVWPMYGILSFINGKFIDVPEGVVYLYAAAQGLSFAGKAAQSFADRPIEKEKCNDRSIGKAKKPAQRD